MRLCPVLVSARRLIKQAIDLVKEIVTQALEDPVVREMVARRTPLAVIKGVDGVVGPPE